MTKALVPGWVQGLLESLPGTEGRLCFWFPGSAWEPTSWRLCLRGRCSGRAETSLLIRQAELSSVWSHVERLCNNSPRRRFTTEGTENTEEDKRWILWLFFSVPSVSSVVKIFSHPALTTIDQPRRTRRNAERWRRRSSTGVLCAPLRPPRLNLWRVQGCFRTLPGVAPLACREAEPPRGGFPGGAWEPG